MWQSCYLVLNHKIYNMDLKLTNAVWKDNISGVLNFHI